LPAVPKLPKIAEIENHEPKQARFRKTLLPAREDCISSFGNLLAISAILAILLYAAALLLTALSCCVCATSAPMPKNTSENSTSEMMPLRKNGIALV